MRYTGQKGAVAPLIAVLLFVIVICVALVVDLGHVHNVKVELQRAVDAAALAAAQHIPDATKVVPVAQAVVAANTADQQQITIAAGDVILGTWDVDALGSPASDRFAANAPNPNAVYVRATLDVEHIFFIFADATSVTADAIAISEPVNPVIPLSIVSCIPVDQIQNDPGGLPDEGICGIKYFTFTPDTDDTAAWSSLTFGASANNIVDYIEDDEQRGLFEQVIFGQGLPNEGIENTNPIYGTLANEPIGCDHPMETNINCGLGKIGGEQLADPDDFPYPSGSPGFPDPPQSLDQDSDGFYEPNSANFDPMFDYANPGVAPTQGSPAHGVLPRWYNVNDDGELKTDDHFTRVWSQDGFLLKNPAESFADYQSRLQGYYEGTVTVPDPFNDGRFVSQDLGGTGFIRGPLTNNDEPLKNAEKEAIAGHFGVTKNDVVYWPNFRKIAKHAGYPKVGVTNGTIASILAAFFGNEEIADGTDLQCVDNPPIDTSITNGGYTLKVQVPVIFAGFCESWKALSNSASTHTLVYVGLADFLMTRAWKNPNDYACPDNFVNATGCAGPYDPPLGAGGDFSVVNANTKGIEGLILPPQVDNAAAASILKLYLVE